MTGGIVILKGVAKSDHFHEHPLVPIFLIAIGIFILVATFFHHWFAKRVTEFKSLLYTCEAIALLVVSYSYFSMGKKFLPICFFICSLAYFVIAYVLHLKKVKSLKNQQ
jgi:ABC-type proline/glycine betaine transport system permease subunit